MRSDAKGPRLYLRPDIRQWVIRDGPRQKRLGIGAGEREEAERQLASYIAAKHRPAREKGRDPAEILIADVLSIYLEDRGEEVARPKELATRAGFLLDWWGEKRLSEIDGRACKDYVRSRGSSAAARRELEDLRAAIRYHWRHGFASHETKVVLPSKPLPRQRWLTRQEAARLLWTAYRRNPHVAKFILVGLYTGSRAGAVCAGAFQRRPDAGFVDTAAGVFWRRPPNARLSRKRQPPCPLAGRLLAHLRRWERGADRRDAQQAGHRPGNGHDAGFGDQGGQRCDPRARPAAVPRQGFVVEWRGQPVRRVTKAFASAAAQAGLKDVTPHTLRHTAATWGMQAGADPWHLSAMLGMTVETLIETYGHWHPDYGREAAESITRGGRRR